MTLLGCGIDSEKSSRFLPAAKAGGHPFPFIFSLREIEHARCLGNPAQALCASFCSKEAVRKAIALPYNYPDCEAFFDEHTLSISLRPASSFCAEFGIEEIVPEVRQNPIDPDEMAVVVSVLGESK
jgi:phosphopantetheinyl transferase (holo-ACP synthase)